MSYHHYLNDIIIKEETRYALWITCWTTLWISVDKFSFFVYKPLSYPQDIFPVFFIHTGLTACPLIINILILFLKPLILRALEVLSTYSQPLLRLLLNIFIYLLTALHCALFLKGVSHNENYLQQIRSFIRC